MQYRRYGNTDLFVSEICFGTMRYVAKEDVSDEQARTASRALHKAIDAGINFIHSSHEYGTRWLTGNTLRDHPQRHDLHHIVKINCPDWGEESFSAALFRKQVENALSELGTEQLAVVQHLHRGALPRELGYCEEGEPRRLQEFDSVTEAVTEEFEKLRSEGKVLYLASFPHTVGFGARVVESGKFSGMVAYYNALETEMLDLFDALQESEMGFICIRPLAGGILTDKRIDRSLLPENDRMRGERWRRWYDQLDEFKSALQYTPSSWTEFALRFAIADRRVTSAVIGINSPEQLDDVLRMYEHPSRDISAAELNTAHRVNLSYRTRFGVQADTAGVPFFATGQ